MAHLRKNNMLHGIDISNWQAGLQLKGLPIDFCIVKATEGIGYIDPSFRNFTNQILDIGLLYGFYHFARENRPEDEASYFFNEVSDLIGQGLPVLDYETSNYDNCEWCERFVARFRELSGIFPIIYCSASVCSEFSGSWLADDCELWVAGYPYDFKSWIYQDCPYNIYPWHEPIIWQFTSSLRISDEYKRLDGNICYITEDEWIDLSGGNMAISDNDAKMIARYVWEYQYRQGLPDQDNIIEDLGISTEADSNRYNVLNACLQLIAKVEELIEKVK